MPTLEDAIILATEKHKGQVDLIGMPYILHPLRVMLAMPTDELRIIAVLHDTMEDTDVTLKSLLKAGYSKDVAFAVRDLTGLQDKTYADYIDRLTVGQDSTLLVKIEDIKDNMLEWRRSKLLSQLYINQKKKYKKALASLGQEAIERNLYAPADLMLNHNFTNNMKQGGLA